LGTIQIHAHTIQYFSIYSKCQRGLGASGRYFFIPLQYTFLRGSFALPLQFISIGLAVSDINEKFWEEYHPNVMNYMVRLVRNTN
jgi:hypothetical protein